ncbi:hypothetical protein DD754_06475 [Helicobacter pylori]|nr:hypothetical protein DD754_06475 [Helicobacter pylori]
MQFFRKFYSLKGYRFTIKLFSLIVRNASSVLDFYSLFFYFAGVAFLFLLFLSCFSLGCCGVCV